jgi:CheY-like chemotaxis protein
MNRYNKPMSSPRLGYQVIPTTAALVVMIIWVVSFAWASFADSAPASGAGKASTASGQDALEKFILQEQETLTNHLQAADRKAQALGESGAGVGTYIMILVAAFAGVIALRKVIPVLAYPFMSDDAPQTRGPAVESPHTHQEAFSEFMEKFNAQQRPGGSRVLAEETVNSRENPQQLALLLDTSVLAQRNALDRVVSMRTLFSELSRAGEAAARKDGLSKMLKASAELKKQVRLPDAHPAGQMVSAMEVLIGQLVSNPESNTASALRTLAGGIDVLPVLCDPGARRQLDKHGPIQVMAVDDDAVIRHALNVALKRVGARPDLAADGQEGARLAESKRYDLILVDIEMPGMDGFELCCRIKNTALNPLTPVVFVTSHNDLATRAKSSLAGGLEFLGKPFMSSELAVKALTLVIKRRLQAQEPVIRKESVERKKPTAKVELSPKVSPELVEAA